MARWCNMRYDKQEVKESITPEDVFNLLTFLEESQRKMATLLFLRQFVTAEILESFTTIPIQDFFIATLIVMILSIFLDLFKK